jgi:hypothetical protein
MAIASQLNPLLLPPPPPPAWRRLRGVAHLPVAAGRFAAPPVAASKITLTLTLTLTLALALTLSLTSIRT